MRDALSVFLDQQARGLGSGKCLGRNEPHSWGPLQAVWNGMLAGGVPAGMIEVKASCMRCPFCIMFPALHNISLLR